VAVEPARLANPKPAQRVDGHGRSSDLALDRIALPDVVAGVDRSSAVVQAEHAPALVPFARSKPDVVLVPRENVTHHFVLGAQRVFDSLPAMISHDLVVPAEPAFVETRVPDITGGAFEGGDALMVAPITELNLPGVVLRNERAPVVQRLHDAPCISPTQAAVQPDGAISAQQRIVQIPEEWSIGQNRGSEIGQHQPAWPHAPHALGCRQERHHRTAGITKVGIAVRAPQHDTGA